MRSDIPYFPGTTLAHLVAAYCRRLESCSTLSCLSHKPPHTSCILTGLHHLSERCLPPIHLPKSPLKNSLCGPDTAIDGPGPSRKYSGWPNIVHAIGLMNLFKMAPLVFLLSPSTVVANNASKLSMINAYRVFFLPTFSLLCPGRTNFGDGLIPGLANIVLY